MFKTELDYFISRQEEIVEEHFGKFLVIKGREIVGVYETALEAYIEAQKEHPLGTFMIQPCQPGPQAYTVTIHPHCARV